MEEVQKLRNLKLRCACSVLKAASLESSREVSTPTRVWKETRVAEICSNRVQIRVGG